MSHRFISDYPDLRNLIFINFNNGSLEAQLRGAARQPTLRLKNAVSSMTRYYCTEATDDDFLLFGAGGERDVPFEDARSIRVKLGLSDPNGNSVWIVGKRQAPDRESAFIAVRIEGEILVRAGGHRLLSSYPNLRDLVYIDDRFVAQNFADGACTQQRMNNREIMSKFSVAYQTASDSDLKITLYGNDCEIADADRISIPTGCTSGGFPVIMECSRSAFSGGSPWRVTNYRVLFDERAHRFANRYPRLFGSQQDSFVYFSFSSNHGDPSGTEKALNRAMMGRVGSTVPNAITFDFARELNRRYIVAKDDDFVLLNTENEPVESFDNAAKMKFRTGFNTEDGKDVWLIFD